MSLQQGSGSAADPPGPRLRHRVKARLGSLGRFIGEAAGSRVLLEYRLLAVLVTAAAVVALLAVPEVPRSLWPLGVLLGLSYYAIASRRERRRARLLSAPFPTAWREVLEQRVPIYRQLEEAERRRFENEVQIFLGEQRIFGLQGLQTPQLPQFPGTEAAPGFAITDEHRVLIAASAATLLLGRPEWRLPTVRDIIVYPTAFTEESYLMEGASHTIGMVHAQGPILFALDALERSYPRPRPASSVLQLPPWFVWGASPEGTLPIPSSNVGIHEFAHVLDFIGQGGRATGAPALIAPEQLARWQQQIPIEQERLASGNSVLHPYGLKNEAELFAVAVESFFQEPLPLRTRHPELYELLAELFNQDPAARAHRLSLAAHRPLFSLASSTPVRYLA
jgi:Mlc titration factor MtfA (ptsG expression regulator)